MVVDFVINLVAEVDLIKKLVIIKINKDLNGEIYEMLSFVVKIIVDVIILVVLNFRNQKIRYVLVMY